MTPRLTGNARFHATRRSKVVLQVEICGFFGKRLANRPVMSARFRDATLEDLPKLAVLRAALGLSSVADGALQQATAAAIAPLTPPAELVAALPSPPSMPPCAQLTVPA
jgi:hypothetical protein